MDADATGLEDHESASLLLAIDDALGTVAAEPIVALKVRTTRELTEDDKSNLQRSRTEERRRRFGAQAHVHVDFGVDVSQASFATAEASPVDDQDKLPTSVIEPDLWLLHDEVSTRSVATAIATAAGLPRIDIRPRLIVTVQGQASASASIGPNPIALMKGTHFSFPAAVLKDDNGIRVRHTSEGLEFKLDGGANNVTLNNEPLTRTWTTVKPARGILTITHHEDLDVEPLNVEFSLGVGPRWEPDARQQAQLLRRVTAAMGTAPG